MNKKNVILMAILITLIGVAFITEEVIKKDAFEIQKMSKKLVKNVEKITAIKTSYQHFIKENSVWKTDQLDWPVNQQLMKDYLKIIAGIQISGVVQEKNISDFITDDKKFIELSIAGKRHKYFLGNVSSVTGAFYVRKEGDPGKIYVCYDDSFLDYVYKTELELNLAKYLRLQNLFEAKQDLFWDGQFYENFKLREADKIIIDNKRNRWYSLNLSQNTTTPAAPSALRYLNIKLVLQNSLNNLKIKRIVSGGKNILTNLGSTIKIFHKQQDKPYLTLKMYRGLNNKFGTYLKSSKHDYIFVLENQNKSPFYFNQQDFWNKRIQYQVNFQQIKNFTFKLGHTGKKRYDFKVDDIETFEVLPKSKEVNFVSKVHINFLFNLLLNLVDFKQASYIEEVEKLDIKRFQLVVELFQKELWVNIGKRFIDVYDTNTKILFHYEYNSQQITPDFFNKIFTVKMN